LPADEVLSVFEDAPSTEIPASDFAGDGVSTVDLIARVQLASSKGEARRLVQSGGVYVNNRRIADVQARLTTADALGGRLFILRKGQRQQHLVKLI
jgi:tyrosyl-tRNA synthetase